MGKNVIKVSVPIDDKDFDKASKTLLKTLKAENTKLARKVDYLNNRIADRNKIIKKLRKELADLSTLRQKVHDFSSLINEFGKDFDTTYNINQEEDYY